MGRWTPARGLYLTFTRWARILLRRRDPRFRKSRTFTFCLAAIIFRREAISNSYWKLTGRVSRGLASTLAGITAKDLRTAAQEMEGGSSAVAALASHPAARELIKTMQSVNSSATWTIFNKRALRLEAISMIMQLGQPLFWMTINPNDKTSPFVMKLGGIDLDVCSRFKDDSPSYVQRLQRIADDPVASADYSHITIQAVMIGLLRFGAKDSDGGVLGRIKAYVGMTEEQKRLTLHCHLLVWSVGYNDFSNLRKTMDNAPDCYQRLATFLSRTIFSQVATTDDVGHAMRGDAEPTGGQQDRMSPPANPLERPATECVAVPPPSACFPPPGLEPDRICQDTYLAKFQGDLANITTKANTHTCTFTCHKHGHAKSCRYASVRTFFVAPQGTLFPVHSQPPSTPTSSLCSASHINMRALTLVFSRFGFDNGGKSLVDRTSVQRGFRNIYPNGDSLVGGVLYPASECTAAVAAANAAKHQEDEEKVQLDSDANEVASRKREFATVAERFTANHRREQPLINSYNATIQDCIRSNMDLKALLRDSDAKGALFYILNYSTKTETTMDAPLNILAPVVERIKDEGDGAPDAVIAAALVRSCSCKTISHMSLGAPAAASKVLGHSDSKCSTDATYCPVWPLLREATDAFCDPVPPPEAHDSGDEEGKAEEDDNESDDDDNGHDVIINAATGKLKMSTRLHHLYFRRCHRNDTGHPYHGMCYVVWTRLVRIEACSASRTSKTPTENNRDDDTDHDDPDGTDIEGCFDSVTQRAPAQKRGRKAANRHSFVGLPKLNKQQVNFFLLLVHISFSLHFAYLLPCRCHSIRYIVTNCFVQVHARTLTTTRYTCFDPFCPLSGNPRKIGVGRHQARFSTTRHPARAPCPTSPVSVQADVRNRRPSPARRNDMVGRSSPD